MEQGILEEIGKWKRGCHKELFSFVWNVKGGGGVIQTCVLLCGMKGTCYRTFYIHTCA